MLTVPSLAKVVQPEFSFLSSQIGGRELLLPKCCWEDSSFSLAEVKGQIHQKLTDGKGVLAISSVCNNKSLLEIIQEVGLIIKQVSGQTTLNINNDEYSSWLISDSITSKSNKNSTNLPHVDGPLLKSNKVDYVLLKGISPASNGTGLTHSIYLPDFFSSLDSNELQDLIGLKDQEGKSISSIKVNDNKITECRWSGFSFTKTMINNEGNTSFKSPLRAEITRKMLQYANTEGRSFLVPKDGVLIFLNPFIAHWQGQIITSPEEKRIIQRFWLEKRSVDQKIGSILIDPLSLLPQDLKIFYRLEDQM